MTTLEINENLKIVNVKDKLFKCLGGYTQITKGFAFHVAGLGYLAFKGDGIDTPYIPCGGKKALREILEAGGLTNYDNVVWIQALK